MVYSWTPPTPPDWLKAIERLAFGRCCPGSGSMDTGYTHALYHCIPAHLVVTTDSAPVEDPPQYENGWSVHSVRVTDPLFGLNYWTRIRTTNIGSKAPLVMVDSSHVAVRLVPRQAPVGLVLIPRLDGKFSWTDGHDWTILGQTLNRTPVSWTIQLTPDNG